MPRTPATPTDRKSRGVLDIVITGASSGIGAAITTALIGEGHRLHICARREDQLAKLTDNGRIAHYAKVDVGDQRQVFDFAESVGRLSKGVDALICCAGAYGPIGSIDHVDCTEWSNAIQANLFGTFVAIKAFLPLLRQREKSRVVTFSGGGAFNPLPNYSAYAVSKAGIVRLTETIAEELRPEGIAVNGIAPGFVRTEIHEATLAAGPALAGEAFYEMTKDKLRHGSVPMETPVNCVRFLLSSQADGLTGKTLSAGFDPWASPAFSEHIDDLNKSELYTMRRINMVNLSGDPIVRLLAENDDLTE